MRHNPAALDPTHDPARQSWVPSANDPASDFPLQNLPWCVTRDEGGKGRVCVRIGERLLHIEPIASAGLLRDAEGAPFDPALFEGHHLSPALLSLPPARRRALRAALADLLDARAPASTQAALSPHLRPIGELLMPICVGDYTDFYASVHHATNVGMMFRPDQPLMPNYKWLPVGYHGRASSVRVSGEPVRRPSGQRPPATEGEAPTFGPCQLLDYELEVGAVIGRGNDLGAPLSIQEAEEAIFGLCLLNDWSARDLQRWEYQPLGPFLAKNFLTTISPYIVTMEALAPFRAPLEPRPEGDPAPLPHLSGDTDARAGGVSARLSVTLSTARSREQGAPPQPLSETDFRLMYWTFAQMVTHHTSSGCDLRPGDLLGSGTVSGPTRGARGCLLELTWDGGVGNPLPTTRRTPITVEATGEQRRFLLDGDEVVMEGRCEREGARRIGFGRCVGRVVG